jgi:hypothetical protein
MEIVWLPIIQTTMLRPQSAVTVWYRNFPISEKYLILNHIFFVVYDIPKCATYVETVMLEHTLIQN